jgi:hypothetical protein
VTTYQTAVTAEITIGNRTFVSPPDSSSASHPTSHWSEQTVAFPKSLIVGLPVLLPLPSSPLRVVGPTSIAGTPATELVQTWNTSCGRQGPSAGMTTRVWVDDSGRIIQVQNLTTFPASEDVPVQFLATVRLYDFGTPAVINAPTNLVRTPPVHPDAASGAQSISGPSLSIGSASSSPKRCKRGTEYGQAIT